LQEIMSRPGPADLDAGETGRRRRQVSGARS